MSLVSKTTLRLVLFLLIATTLLSSLFMQRASAAVDLREDCSRFVYNRCLNEGYFTGTEGHVALSGDSSIIFPITTDYSYADNPFFPGGAASRWSFPRVPGCQDSNQQPIGGCRFNSGYTTTFINQMRWLVNSDYLCVQYPLNATDACGKTRVNAIGSAMIINTMLGRNGTDYGNYQWGVNNCNSSSDWYNDCYKRGIIAGVTYARNNFDRWERLVRAYDAGGLVAWSSFMTVAPNHNNSTGMNYGTDAEFFNNTDTTYAQFIRFLDPTDPSKSLFTINRGCGNIIGTALLPYPLEDSTLRGVKIDDSRVSAVGSNTGYGGDCYSVSSPGNCGNGALVDFPFSDDCVSVAGSACGASAEANPFIFTRNIEPGLREVTISARGSPNGSLAVSGFSICETGAGCTSQYLTRTSNIRAGSSFIHYFQPGKTYDMRWIYTDTTPPVTNAVSCSAPSTVIAYPNQTVNMNVSFSPGVASPHAAIAYTASHGFADASVGAGVLSPLVGAWIVTDTADDNFTVSGVTAPSTPNTYTGQVTLNLTGASNATATCALTLEVINSPYLRVYGADVFAGIGFPPSCSPTAASPKILAFNRGISGGYAGAGTQFAAFAMSTIDEFASANSAGPRAPKRLSFANDDASDAYGGNYLSSHCVADYWKDAPTAPAPPSSQTIGTQTVTAATDGVIYVDGDVRITGNITYNAGWGSLADIPSFMVVSRGGNIYIDRSVSQLDGIYVAIPSGPSNGRIYTCSNTAAGSPAYTSPIPADAATGCGTQLTINGAFVAEQVKFLRTNGDYNTATAGEGPNANIAEIFIYGPEVWLSQ